MDVGPLRRGGVCGTIGGVPKQSVLWLFFRPYRAYSIPACYSGLAPWAALLRRFAAGGWQLLYAT